MQVTTGVVGFSYLLPPVHGDAPHTAAEHLDIRLRATTLTDACRDALRFTFTHAVLRTCRLPRAAFLFRFLRFRFRFVSGHTGSGLRFRLPFLHHLAKRLRVTPFCRTTRNTHALLLPPPYRFKNFAFATTGKRLPLFSTATCHRLARIPQFR